MKHPFKKIQSLFEPLSKSKPTRVPLWQQANMDNAKYMELLKTRLSPRIQRDIDNNDIQRAIDRYEGFLKRFPLEQDFHYNLGILYMEINDKVRAGKHFYFKENPSVEEQECITVFEKHFGNDNAIILKKFMPKEHFKISACEPRIQLLIKDKIETIEKETGKIPKFLIGVYNHLNKKGPDYSEPL